MTIKSASMNLTTAEAFYRLFCTFPKKEQLSIARFILENEIIRHELGLAEIPNDVTLAAFAEDKATMASFDSIDKLRHYEQ